MKNYCSLLNSENIGLHPMLSDYALSGLFNSRQKTLFAANWPLIIENWPIKNLPEKHNYLFINMLYF